jgi:hypothetical protein
MTSRQFVGRVVTWATGQGIPQFLDLGAGLPAHPAVHETAREIMPTRGSAMWTTIPSWWPTRAPC